MKTHKQFLAESLKNPEVGKASDASRFEFGIIKKLLEYRIKKNLNQRELAYKLGISKYLLNKFMLDPDNSRLFAIQKITQGLGLKLTVR